MPDFHQLDLGQIYAQAGQINAAKEASAYNKLRTLALEEDMANQRSDRALQQKQFTEEQRVANAEWLATVSDKILADPNPQEALRAATPEFHRRGILPSGFDPSTDPEALNNLRSLGQQAKMAVAKPAGAPLSAEGKVSADQRSGYLTEAQATAAMQPGQGGAAPGSLQELASINADRAARGESPMRPEEYLSQRRGSSAESQLYAQYANAATARGETPVPIDEFLVSHRGSVAGSQQGAQETQKRLAGQIDEGYRAADSLPVVVRGLELLDGVKTGGLNAAELAATNLFGITGADEAELSANLGKAVLAQLRSTFGAAFTEREGARLQEIEAGFGKSTEGNRRLLEQAKRIVERVANRGISAARESGNAFDADEIQKAMSMSLSDPGEASSEPTQAAPRGVDPSLWEFMTPEERALWQ